MIIVRRIDSSYGNSRVIRGEMMADLTPYQQKIAQRYYDNLDSIKLQRLKELVSDLYLSTGKKRTQVWNNIARTLEKLGFTSTRIDHLRNQDNPALMAEIVTDLEKKKP
jgi:acetylornithine deacetylase/succinyl-diaminopimelate desuccinylase-like protein